jgi:hypothetical protein
MTSVWGDEPVTARKVLAALAVVWTVGVAFLVASWFDATAQNRVRHAPTCSQSQLFTSADCRVTLDATMTALTDGHAAMDIGERHVSADVTLNGQLPDVVGLRVQVTLYRGEPVHVEGSGLKIDTNAAPATGVGEARFFGLACLIGGTFLVGTNALLGSVRRDDSV